MPTLPSLFSSQLILILVTRRWMPNDCRGTAGRNISDSFLSRFIPQSASRYFANVLLVFLYTAVRYVTWRCGCLILIACGDSFGFSYKSKGNFKFIRAALRREVRTTASVGLLRIICTTLSSSDTLIALPAPRSAIYMQGPK